MHISAFNENTSQEMEDNLKKLGETNVKGLMLDLRENPGGLLNEGVAVAGHYLRKGEVVVSHRGRTPRKNRIWPGAALPDRIIPSWFW